KVDPSNWIAHTNLGYIFLKSGRTREAIRHFSEALRINPEDHRARHNLHLALKRLEN
ncbi:MAG: tetratricopeptide repeat protein, partial [Deltaproteobacteria bacterium]|nr:tetratricopeptide repeat protein [Deltaproteobacteria bacterium]